MTPTRNSAVLASFVAHCEAHPDMRFWQALCSWSGYDRILGSRMRRASEGSGREIDTFYLEGRNEEQL